MPERNILQHCAPTLAGIKTGSMFTAEYASEEDMHNDMRSFSELFKDKGLEIKCLRYKNGRALIYIYRPHRLSADLGRRESREILIKLGYKGTDHVSCLDQLIGRFSSGDDFPHEIGLFLGYPPEDVKGFIENKAREHKAEGLWKVYGDVERASELFRKYSKCTKVYMDCWQRGTPLSRLAVNTSQAI